MVSEHANLAVTVNKTFVKSGNDRNKADLFLSVLKNLTQTFNLLGAVAQYIYCVAVTQELAERLTDEVKVLVEQALRSASEVNSMGATVGLFVCGGEMYLPETGKGFAELFWVNQPADRLSIPLISKQRALAEPLLFNCPDAFHGVGGITHGNDGVRVNEFKKGDPFGVTFP